MEFLKDYKTMTGEEQVKFLVELNEFVNEKLPRLKTQGDAWGAADRRDVEQGLRLLGAFPFARDFVGKAFRYGDFKARVARLDVYVEKAKQAVRNLMGRFLEYEDDQKYKATQILNEVAVDKVAGKMVIRVPVWLCATATARRMPLCLPCSSSSAAGEDRPARKPTRRAWRPR